mgnify:CR=1
MTKFIVTFTKYSESQFDHTEVLGTFPVEAPTRAEAVRTALEMWRVGNKTDEWESIRADKHWGS